MISVIVPVYKVEKYLRRCVDSILAQTYTDFELLLIDDGSPDGCPQICDEYAGIDSRVRVIHKPNGGSSSARNAGIEISTGSYIGFVDSDDFVDVDYLEVLYNAAEDNDSEMVLTGQHKVDVNGNTIANICIAPFVNSIGKRHQIHPYRRSTILATVICTFPFVLPYGGCMLLLLKGIEASRSNVTLQATDMFLTAFYPWLLLICSFATCFIRKRHNNETTDKTNS